MPKVILMAHIDFENIRWRFREYVEYITLEKLVEAFKSIGEEIGELRQMFFYGDWTRRPQDARKIEELGCRAINVLSKVRGSDRSDPTMMFAIDDQSRQREITAFLLGAGDADYKEVVLRCRERGKNVYVVCFGRSAARELFTMTEGVYPLEARLGLKERQQTLPTLELIDEQSKRKHFIQRIDSLEKTLDYVVRNYVRDKILLPIKLFGETRKEVDNYLDNELKQGYFKECSIANPKLPGKQVICFKLERDDQLVIDSLTATNEETRP